MDRGDDARRSGQGVKTHFRSLILIAALILITYSNALFGAFLWDDEFLIEKNLWVQDTRHLKELLTHDLHAFAPRPGFYYRPLQSLTYLLEICCFKWGVRGIHLTNLLFHLAAAGLVYLLAFQLGFSTLKALLVSLLFGLHPTLTGSVTYISGRADPLVTLWSLVSVLGLLHFLRTGRKRGYLVSVFSFVLALLSKEIALILPLIFFLLILFFSEGKAIRKGRLLSGYLGLALCTLAGRFFLFGRLWGIRKVSYSLWQLTVFSAKSILVQVRLLFLPFPLYLERYVDARAPFWDSQARIGLFFLALLFLFWRKARSRRADFGWGWFWIFIFAGSPWVLHVSRYADHALYLPLIGVGMVVVDGASVLLRQPMQRASWRWAVLFLMAGLLGFFAVKTHLRNRDWQDPETFYNSILKYNPNSTTALNNLADLYDRRGEKKKAEVFYKKVIDISPMHAEAYSDFGNLLLKEGRLEEAIGMQQKALALRPDVAEIHHNLASAYRMRGECQEAITSYQKALSLKPYLIETHYFLAQCYETLGQKKKADEQRRWLLEQGVTVIKVKTVP